MSESNSTGRRGVILIIEDEQPLQELLQYNLMREGYDVFGAERGETGLDYARQHSPRLILLDLMLPGMDGLEVCRALKQDPKTADVPIIMVTAKGEESDVVIGLELGADDYMVKPFSPRVLVARVRAVLRRRAERRGDEEVEGKIEVGPIVIDRERHEVSVRNELIELTATEFRLLELLANRPGRVFTRQQIIHHIHGTNVAVTDRSVDVQVVGLRRKLGEASQFIQTVRGIGYRFMED